MTKSKESRGDDLIKTIAIVAAGIGLIAGASKSYNSYKRNHYDTSWNITGSQTNSNNFSDKKFNLEQIVVDGQQWYVTQNENAMTNELPVKYLRTDKVNLELDNGSSPEITPHTSTFYIPTLVTNSAGEMMHKLPLSQRLDRHAFSLGSGGVERGVVNYTQKDIPLTLPTMKIQNEEFYIVSNQTTNSPYGDFYQVPKKGTTVLVSPEGKLVLKSRRGIYGLNGVDSTAYDQRALETNAVPQINYTPVPFGPITTSEAPEN